MSNKRLWSHDELTGAVEYFDYDEETDTVLISRHEDVTDRLELNKAMRTSGDPGWLDKDKSMRAVAEIPVGVQMLWLQMYGIRAWDKNHMPAVLKLLDSNEWRYLRTNEVFIGKYSI